MHGDIPGIIVVAKTGLSPRLTLRDAGIMGIPRRPGGHIMGLRRCRVAGPIIKTRSIGLTPIGRLLPLMLGIMTPVVIPRLAPLALVAIPAITITAGLLPLALMAIPTEGIPLPVPLALMIIPALAVAAMLLPLSVLTMPTIGNARRLLPVMRLVIPTVSKSSGLG